jgi:hypothetical protein
MHFNRMAFGHLSAEEGGGGSAGVDSGEERGDTAI